MRMPTIEEMNEAIKSAGCQKIFKPRYDPETGAISIRTKKPSKITNGKMLGRDIYVYDNQTFEIWTSETRKAAKIALEHGLKIEKLDGEAMLFVPSNLADTLLPMFGAKVKRCFSSEQLEKAKAALEHARRIQSLR